ncbi:MAG: serine hydrolase domain-containing protein, partial [Burkholderiaceae bacterium]
MYTMFDTVTQSRRRFLQVSGVALLAGCLPGCGSDINHAIRFGPTIDWGRDRIAEHMRRNPNAATVSIALLYEGDVVWQEAFGLAAVQDARPTTVDTRFSIASVSKVLAGLAGAILQDMGVLDLDRPVAQYLPGFYMLSPSYTEITSRHLLSHTSGLPGSNDRNALSFVPIPGFAEDTEAGFSHYHLKHAPGQLAVYCNDGFTLFERVVLAVSGLSYPEFIRKHILEPLGMSQSGFLVETENGGDFAFPYLDGKQYGLMYPQIYASGGLYTTPGDMMKLAQMLIDRGKFEGRRIVSEAGIAEVTSDQTGDTTINPSPESLWGLGWDSVRQLSMDAAGFRAWQKNGATAFFQTDFLVLPEARMALLITGSTGYEPTEIVEGVLLRALQDAGLMHAVPS